MIAVLEFAFAFDLITRSFFVASSLEHNVPLGCFPLQRQKSFDFFLVWKLQMIFDEAHGYSRAFVFFKFFEIGGFDFAPAPVSPANDSEDAMISLDYTISEHPKTWLLSSNPGKKIREFSSECFFQTFGEIFLVAVTRQYLFVNLGVLCSCGLFSDAQSVFLVFVWKGFLKWEPNF